MAFVAENNVAIPAGLQGTDILSEFTLELILCAYQSPNVPFCFNYTETQNYAEAIRSAVKQYMPRSASTPVTLSTSYSLQYNKVRDANNNWVTSGGVYNSAQAYYNCYAFSINRVEQPSFYATTGQYQPGDMSGAGSFVFETSEQSISELAAIVCADLQVMGYSNVTSSLFLPTVDSSQELICIRRSDTDYHFMKYDAETDAWYHKPGGTAILKYNYEPSNARLWYQEYCNANGTFSNVEKAYTSDIVFIRYFKNRITLSDNTTSQVVISAGKDVLYEVTAPATGNYTVQLSADSPFKYELYKADLDMDVVSSSESCTSRTISLTTTSADRYYLRLSFVNSSVSDSIAISAATVSHTHLYSHSYIWNSYKNHKAFCSCGGYQIRAHVVTEDAFSSGAQYANCLRCGGLAEFGSVGALSLNELYHSANGSFILPNGVIVLVDEDIDAYMDGTLTFTQGDVS